MDRPSHPKEAGRGGLVEFLHLALIIIGALVAAVVIRTFVCEPFVIPSGSMEDTLEIGDRIIGEKVTYRVQEPKAGDIVTFVDPDDASQILIKRVVATAGQTVSLEGGQVVVDGVVLDEPYTEGKPSVAIARHAANLPDDVSYPYTVPEGSVWVMGDNRTDSLDSRYFGAIPVSSITSRAAFRFWPLDTVGLL